MAIRVPKGARPGTDIEAVDVDLTDAPVDLEELFQHREALHSICQRIVGDAATADDMVQETYLRALRNLDRLERRPSLMPWLATVARRRSLDELRRRKYSTTVEDFPDEPGHIEHEPHESVPVADTLDRVREAFSTLNARERRLLRRQVEEGLTLSELAEDDASSVASVRSVLVRARAKLREALGENEIWLPVATPLAGAWAWLRRRMEAFNLKVQQTASSVPVERLGEVVTAGVVTVALGAGVASPAPEGSGGVEREFAAPAADTATAPSQFTAEPADDVGVLAQRSPSGEPGIAIETGALPGDGARELVLPPDDVEEPEDARFEHFSVAGSPRSPVVVAAGTRRTGCIAGCTVLFRSLDGGATWEKLAAEGLDTTSIAVAPAYPADPRIFAAGAGGLLVSRDGGQSFRPVGVPGQGPVALSPAFATGDERVFVGTSPPWIWDDASGTATPLLGVPAGDSTTHFAFTPDYARSGVLFATGTAPHGDGFRPAIYRCDRNLVEDTCVEHTLFESLRQPPRVAVSPAFPVDQTVFAWTDNVFLRSTDGGRTFAESPIPANFAVGTVAGDSAATMFAAARGLSGASEGGVFRSFDRGASWHVVATGTAVDRGAVTVAVLPDDTILVAPLGGGSGGVLCSPDHGQTWKERCR